MKKKEVYKHQCGCKTERVNGVIEFNKMCKRHKNNNKHIWIALQHEDALVSGDEQ